MGAAATAGGVLSDTVRRQCADVLLAAYDDRRTLPPLTSVHPGMTVDDAYAVQLAQVGEWQRAGRRLVGFKVGLTSEAMRAALGVHEPDFGHLFADMGAPDGGDLPAERLLQARAEPEIAFVLGRDLPTVGVTAADVLGATAAVAPALEIIDSRITDWRIALADTVADNGSSGMFVLGPHRPPAGIDLPGLRCELLEDGEVVDAGVGAAVMGDPAEAVAWLANELGRRGATLAAGQVVLSGSCTAAHALVPGRRVEARFDGLGSASVRAPAAAPARAGVR